MSFARRLLDPLISGLFKITPATGEKEVLRLSLPTRTNLSVLEQAQNCAKVGIPFTWRDVKWLITSIDLDGDEVVIKGMHIPAQAD